MGFGHRPNSHGDGRPSAKYLWSSAVSVKSSKVSVSRPSLQRSWPLGLSAKSPKVLAFRSLGQVSKGLGLSVSRPSLQRSRPLGLSAKSPKGLDLSVSRPSLQKVSASRSLGQVDWASGNQVGPSLAQYRYTCPPGSRADVSDMSDESLIMGVGWPPLDVRSFHFSRFDLTRRRDMTSDGTT